MGWGFFDGDRGALGGGRTPGILVSFWLSSSAVSRGFSVPSRVTMISADSCFSTMLEAAHELGGADGYPGSHACHFLSCSNFLPSMISCFVYF